MAPVSDWHLVAGIRVDRFPVRIILVHIPHYGGYMRLAGRRWSLLLRRNGTTIVNLCTSALRWRFSDAAEAVQCGDEFLKPANQHSARPASQKSTNEREIKMTSTTVVKDPVCGMDIETATAAGQTEYKGQTYYFCGAKCKETFDLTPDQYLGQTAGTPKSGPGCCG